MLTMVNNKERKYEMAEEYRNCMYQKLETLLPSKHSHESKTKRCRVSYSSVPEQIHNKFSS